MSTFNLDSASFNAKSYFKNFVKDKSIDELLRKNNEVFAGTVTLTLTQSSSFRDSYS